MIRNISSSTCSRRVSSTRLAVDRDGAHDHVEAEIADLEHPPVLAAPAADDGPRTGLQFAEIEGLDHVVVGALVERADLVVDREPGAVSTRTGTVLRATRSRRRKSRPGAVGQVDVENDQVIGGQCMEKCTASATVVAWSQAWPALTKRVDDRLGHIRRVFDHEEMHGLTLSAHLTACMTG